MYVGGCCTCWDSTTAPVVCDPFELQDPRKRTKHYLIYIYIHTPSLEPRATG